ncbi:MAG: alpha-amylase family glycosyl hydrolase, partial [Kiritimatiellaeota bacterium]|nr:alpha-amylase family glycosyl hydrolase [Kiritimatiellota bacterium]
LVGDFSGWARKEGYRATKIEERGVWELRLPMAALAHGQHYRLEMEWPGGGGLRLPAYARRVVQDTETLVFTAQVWDPPPYAWQHAFTVPNRMPVIYEAHIGMAQEKEGVGTYDEFRRLTLPRIAAAGYNTLQLMAIMEHPYYGSFGYQVSSFFAASSRFGTPADLKALIDEAHGLGIAVIMDLVHSHAVANPEEGITQFDGTGHLYFHDGSRGWHSVWESRCFDYGKIDTLHFLLSNCRYWLDEFRFDGFRFDGVTSMLYLHHGLGFNFTHYSHYFDASVDEEAYVYLALANRLVHALRPDAITVAEDVSGMPGLAAPENQNGVGFDYRLAMGVPECWTRLVTQTRDEEWSLSYLWYELANRRQEEQTVSYVESHDQALVGGKTLFFQMADAAMYDAMRLDADNVVVERALALHTMARLATLATASYGYLNFMGNEFGHPEWIDFPREGNQWSYRHARRQWSLADNPALRYHALAAFDAAILPALREGTPVHALAQAKAE